MNSSAKFLNPSEAAKRLGVSSKALRLYEQRGLVAPVRTANGWRVYGPGEMARAAEIAALRALGLSLAQVAQVLESLSWLLEEGGTTSDALFALVVGLEAEGPTALVIDMVEQGLDQATQSALISRLRRRAPGARPLFLMTRSNAILDLAEVGSNEAIIYCPANHSPPIRVAPYPGTLGYEAVATCLAPPEVRARTEGMRARMPEVA